MGIEQKIIKADKARLYGAIYRRGLTVTAACREMGFSESYLSTSFGDYGGVSERTAKYLEAFIGITRDEYEIKEPAEPAPAAIVSVMPDPPELPDILKMTKDEIHDLLYSAIVKAILDALE